jgi:hypothetical protein
MNMSESRAEFWDSSDVVPAEAAADARNNLGTTALTKEKDAKQERPSYEDTEGMLVNLGVTCALVLSFSVGLYGVVSTEHLHPFEFHSALMEFGDHFCEYALSYLEMTEFNTSRNILVDTNKTWDVLDTQFMCHNKATHWDPKLEVTIDKDNVVRHWDWQPRALWDLVANQFPHDVLVHWRAKNNWVDQSTNCWKDIFGGGRIHQTFGCSATLCLAFLTASLWSSLIAYLALIISSAREKANADKFNVLVRFQMYFAFLNGFAYFQFLCGIYLFFIQLVCFGWIMQGFAAHEGLYGSFRALLTFILFTTSYAIIAYLFMERPIWAQLCCPCCKKCYEHPVCQLCCKDYDDRKKESKEE